MNNHSSRPGPGRTRGRGARLFCDGGDEDFTPTCEREELSFPSQQNLLRVHTIIGYELLCCSVLLSCSMVMFLVFQYSDVWAQARIIIFRSSSASSSSSIRRFGVPGRGPMSCRPPERTQLKGPLEKIVAGCSLGVLFHTCTQKARRSRARRRPQRRAPAGAAADRAAALVNDHTPRGKVYAVSFYVIFVLPTEYRFALVVSALVIRWCSVHPDPHEICTL
jgi:hypothetical protein